MRRLFLILASCGRVAFDARQDAAIDAAPDALLPPFSNVAPVAELNTTMQESDPSLTEDQLEMYFVSDRAPNVGGSDIWRTTRPATSSPWSTPVPVTELNTAAGDLDPEVSREGLTLYFARGSSTGIFVSTRTTRANPWGAPSLIAELDSPGDDSAPAPNVDATVLVFSSQRSGGVGSRDLYQSTRASPGDSWGVPINLASVSSSADDMVPWLSADARILYFASPRPGVGMRDIYRASRGSPDDSFGAPVRVDEIATTGNDSDPWVADDERTIYFVRTAAGDSEIFRATR